MSLTKDFSAFADPATAVMMAGDDIVWTQNRQRRQATLVRQANDLPDLIVDGRQYKYREFFASDSMADLTGLANNIKAVIPTLSTFVADVFVDPEVVTEDVGSGREETCQAGAFIESFLSPAFSAERTQLLFLKGRAGDGKSTLLVHLTYRQAELVLNGGATRLLLYVDAQGSALAKIDEVMAKVTHDFGARFRYHAIAVLTRLGLLVPIIDGFDELLGVAGYKDAFSSLSRFIARLDGSGHLIASARSTFFEYTDFAAWGARLTGQDDAPLFEITPASIRPWGQVQRQEYFARNDASALLPQMEEILAGRANEVLSSPFLVSQLINLGVDVVRQTPPDQLVHAVVQQLIDREMRFKVLNLDGRPLLTLGQHEQFLQMVAEEMWWLESREVDETTLLAVADLVVEQLKLAPEVAFRFREKVPSYALFVRSESPPRYAFRHEFYFAYFVAQTIRAALDDSVRLEGLLSRSVVTPVVADQIASQTTTAKLAQSIGKAGKLGALSIQNRGAVGLLKANHGAIVGAAVRLHGELLAAQEIVASQFVNVDFSNTHLNAFSFVDCSFVECDLSGAQWSEVDFDASELTELVVTDGTRLAGCTLDSIDSVIGLIERTVSGTVERLYAARDLKRLLERMGMRVKSDPGRASPVVGEHLREQLDRFLRVAQRTVYFSDQDFSNRSINMERDLAEVVDLLRKSGLLLSAAKKHRSGSRMLFRLSEPAERIRQGEAGIFSSASIEQFWSDMVRGTARKMS
jgi:uncharacterized protein YjbI with pentapeptide repeats